MSRITAESILRMIHLYFSGILQGRTGSAAQRWTRMYATTPEVPPRTPRGQPRLPAAVGDLKRAKVKEAEEEEIISQLNKDSQRVNPSLISPNPHTHSFPPPFKYGPPRKS